MAGSVRRRGNSWQALLSFRDPARPGRTRQLPATRPTKKDAENVLAELVLRRDRAHVAAGKHTFAMAAEQWRTAKEMTAAPSSLLRYDMALDKHLLPRLGSASLERLSAAQLDAYYADLPKAGLADDTILWHHNLISNVLH